MRVSVCRVSLVNVSRVSLLNISLSIEGRISLLVHQRHLLVHQRHPLVHQRHLLVHYRQLLVHQRHLLVHHRHLLVHHRHLLVHHRCTGVTGTAPVGGVNAPVNGKSSRMRRALCCSCCVRFPSLTAPAFLPTGCGVSGDSAGLEGLTEQVKDLRLCSQGLNKLDREALRRGLGPSARVYDRGARLRISARP